MEFLYAALLAGANLVWLALNLVGLPGNWLIVATSAAAWWLSEKQMFHYGVLIALIGLAVAGEILEFLLGAAGAAKAGGSKRGAAGAIFGAILGGIIGTFAIPIPLIGSILGACGGAFLGATVMEMQAGKRASDAANVGRGAAIGRFWGTITKLLVGGAMWATATVAAFWP